MKNKTQKNITFLWGLPGSGKTTYADSFKRRSKTCVIDLDAITLSSKDSNVQLKELGQQFKDSLLRNNDIFVDGLITTNQHLRRILDYLNIELVDYNIVYHLVVWKEDRATCLWNDQHRDRVVKAKTSIQNMPFEKPDLKILKELNQRRINYMKVERGVFLSALFPGVDFSKNQIDKDANKLYGESWSGGGSSGNCWDSELIPISASSPLEFDELDTLLEKLCPGITHLQYRRVNRECCQVEERFDSDYYGGGTTHFRHVCDLKKLYDCLVSMGLMEDSSQNE